MAMAASSSLFSIVGQQSPRQKDNPIQPRRRGPLTRPFAHLSEVAVLLTRGGVHRRVGHGFDLHRLEPGYPLIIGGINIPHDRGCEAHSDGDVLLHCVVDAILGALGTDIPRHRSQVERSRIVRVHQRSCSAYARGGL